jgi:hypothetical protein
MPYTMVVREPAAIAALVAHWRAAPSYAFVLHPGKRGAASAPVGRCRLTVSKPVLKAPVVSDFLTKI